MKVALCYPFIRNLFRKSLLLFIVVSFTKISYAQPCPDPVLFGVFGANRPTIICKGQQVFFGAIVTKSDLTYDFTLYHNGAKKKKGGPLTGNGGTLSVAAVMRSVQDAGEYRITINNKCGDTASYNFYVFSSDIDNLSISSWGSNSVTARWSAGGPRPAVTYEYAVTTYSDPNSSFISYQTTTDTVVSASGLTSGTTYYVHVRVKGVSFNGDPIYPTNGGINNNGVCSMENLPFETISFVSCSGSATIGSVTPVNAIVCTGGTVNLTATGGSTYQWYDRNNILIPGANSAVYTASSPGIYKTYVTTGAGCQGMIYTASILDTALHTGDFFGGGLYCMGDSVKMGIFNTIASQAYIILKDGQPVYTIAGIGQDLLESNSIKSEDTIWYKFKIDSPTQAGTYSVWTSSQWCTNSLTFGSQIVSTSANPVSSLAASSITDRTVDFSWSAPATWVNKFEYAVNTSVTPPASGTITANLYGYAAALNPSTTYWIHVRPVCQQSSLAWTTISFTTLAAYTPCTSTSPVINACIPVTRYITTGTGTWNFNGSYPVNSVGGSTPGRERLFRFTPSQTGVYYFDVIASNGAAVHYLYKLNSAGCNTNGWTGIRVISVTGKYPIGMLQQGTEYLFVMDNAVSTDSASQTFKICRSTVAAPSRLNECIETLPIPFIPALSPKEEFIIDTDGNLIASIDSSFYNLNNVTASYYVNSGVIRKVYGREYLDRTFEINAYSAKVKLFFSNAELQRLVNEPNDGIADVSVVNDLKASTDAEFFCPTTPGSYLAQLVNQMRNGSYDANSQYIVFYSTVSRNYFLHGGNARLDYSRSPDYAEDFGENTFPTGWSQQLVSGNGNMLFVQSSDHPATVPYSGSHYVKWNSWDYTYGTETRLISPPLYREQYTVNSNKNLRIEFYWYNENNSDWSSGIYLNEGVQVQYSFNGTDWLDIGPFIPRHDASLPDGTGLWKKKTVALPLITNPNHYFVYVAFKFHSEFGDNCSLDAVSFKWAPGCDSIVTALSITNVLSNSVSFGWNPIAGISGYQYHVGDSPDSTIQQNNANAKYLQSGTNYSIAVRPVCSPGIFGDWTVLPFTTPAGPVFCEGIQSLTSCTTVATTIPAGTGEWDFAPDFIHTYYPINSAGRPTPGKEKIFSFTPPDTGVYYIDILSASEPGWVDFLYKPASSGCNDKEWIGIDDVHWTGKRAIGMLNKDETYLIAIDNESTGAITKTFRICRAEVAAPITNTCSGTFWLPNDIPANSPKTEYVLDNDGNVYAGLDFQTINNNLSGVGLSYYINDGAVRHDALNKEYLDRSYTIVASNAPHNYNSIFWGVDATFFFRNIELQKLIDEPNDGIGDVSTLEDLNVTRVLQSCSANIQNGLSLGLGGFGVQYDQNSSYVAVEEIKAFGTFFIHGVGELTTDNMICPSAGFVSFSFGSGGSGQWQVDTGSGFQNLSDNSIYSGTRTGYLSLTNPPTSLNGYKYRCYQVFIGADTLFSPVRTLKFVVKWNGSTSSSWHNAANWDCGVVPDANTDVIIDNTGFSPVVSSNVFCKSVSAKQGANITVSPGVKLTITGH